MSDSFANDRCPDCGELETDCICGDGADQDE